MPPLNNFTRTCLATAIIQSMLMPAHAANIVVTDAGDSDPVGACTLRQAIISANTDSSGASLCTAGSMGADTITFANNIGNTITLSSTTIIGINDDLTITGNGLTTIQGVGNRRVFSIDDSIVSLNSLTITSGGIQVEDSSTLTISNSTLSGNSASQGGAILASVNTSVHLENSHLLNNSAVIGAAMYIRYGSTLTMVNGTVSGNSASSIGGGIYGRSATSLHLMGTQISSNSSIYGGGLRIKNNASATLENCTISNNLAQEGAGLYVGDASSMNLTNSTVSDNEAGESGGGIDLINESSISIVNTTLSGNSAGEGGGINAKLQYSV